MLQAKWIALCCGTALLTTAYFATLWRAEPATRASTAATVPTESGEDTYASEPTDKPVLTVSPATLSAARHSGHGGRPSGHVCPPAVLIPAMAYGIGYKPGERWVEGETRERPDGSFPPIVSAVRYTTSYDVVEAKGRGTELAVVLGRARNGDSIVERWTLTQPTGAWTATRDPAPPVVGVPVVSASLDIAIQGGGSFLPPSQRTAPAPATRIEAYRGPSLGDDLELEVDPDGRFALILSRDQVKLWRVMLEEDGEAVAVHDVATMPELQYMRRMEIFRHVTYGRQLRAKLHGHATFSDVVFFDSNNDGVFEGHLFFTLQEFAQFGLPHDWAEDFTNYTGVGAPHQW